MPADGLQIGARVIAEIMVTHVASSGEAAVATRLCPGRVIHTYAVGDGTTESLTAVDVMLDNEGVAVRLPVEQVRLAVPDDVIDNVRTAADPAIAAQLLDARLARQAKATGELGHIAEQTRLAAAADVDRINLIRRRLRVIFPDLPDLDGEDGP